MSADACRILPQPSKVLAVSLPRPMGIVLEEDTRRGRVVVSELAEGSEAAKRAKVREGMVDMGNKEHAPWRRRHTMSRRAITGVQFSEGDHYRMAATWGRCGS